MICKYHHVQKREQDELGNAKTITVKDDLCRLKEQDKQKRLKVNRALLQKGLVRSLVVDTCPVAPTSRWKECPFFEPE